MTKDEFQKQIVKIEGAFGKKFTQPLLAALFKVIKGYHIKHLQEGVQAILISCKMQPANKEIIEAVRVSWEQDWANRKKQEDHQAKDFLGGAAGHTPYGLKAFKAMESARISSTITGKTFLMYELDKEYPGRGWAHEADLLKSKLTTMGVPE